MGGELTLEAVNGGMSSTFRFPFRPAAPEPVPRTRSAPVLPADWAQGFALALTQGNITRLRHLGEASGTSTPCWLSGSPNGWPGTNSTN